MHFILINFDFSYYEEGGDTFIKNTLSGVFLNQPALPPFSFGAHFGLSYFYLWLYKLMPSVAWYDFFTVLYSTLAAILVFFSLKRVLPNARISIVFILSFLLYLDNILMIEITRISMFIAICSTFLILSNQEKESKFDITFFQITLTLSVFLRIESFFVSVLLMLSFVVANRGYIRNIKFLIPSFTFSIILSFLLNVDWTDRDKKYNDLRQFQFAFLDLEINQKVPFANTKDSIIMETSKSFFLNDEKNINADFFKKYLLPQDKNIFHITNFFKQTDFSISALKKKLSRTDLRYYVFLFLSTLFIFLSPSNAKRKKAAFILVYFLVVLTGILLFFKMENRVLYPSLFGMILLISFENRIEFKATLFFFTITCFLLIPNEKFYELKNRYNDVELIFYKTSTLPSNTIVFLEGELTVYVGRKPFKKEFSRNKILSIDNALLFMLNEYKQTMYSVFQTSHTAEILNMCSENGNCIFFGDIERAILINDYFKIIYDFNTEINKFDSISPQISVYNLISKQI